ncbi:MAG: formate dehydrogenase [Bordetella sp. SCN 67-23]|uniref:formate dehydrogenase subunit delta n=1 Tax=Pigmentiphaga sp. YJ18 TaxID=3134907 RepID=UPI00086B8B31|nr:formate dehydrogenase subunit delta [Burkholderiales bacterium]ODS72306.1 MAG: formate dehydrogenase [Bordetella sp. SCN 67-23]ODU85790.1 MAG: formate dehydrogenase [Bordetella sp. SCN 68-11]OJW88931.1 MAG: formate dehydrogenase [Burkholderiales bacterium 67-32]
MNAANNLIRMANQIGDFFSTMPDRPQAIADVADHLKRFWEPRMRRALLAHLDAHGDAELNDMARQAVREHRERLL